MRRNTLIIALVVLVLGGAVAGGLYWRWYNSPRYALQQMALALETRNMDKFFNYLDLKAIFNKFLEDSSHDLDAPEDPEADDWTRMSQRLARKFARSLLPKLFNTFETQIRGVMQKYLLNLDNSQILGIAAAATVAKIDTQGDEAQVTLTDPKTKKPFRFQMHRDSQRRRWQIVSVNYPDLKMFCQKEFR
jgi:hypothetical protein